MRGAGSVAYYYYYLFPLTSFPSDGNLSGYDAVPSTENTSVSHYKNILGSDKLSYTVQPTDGRGQHTFYVEGLAFPDGDFNGLVSLNATLLEQTSSVTDSFFIVIRDPCIACCFWSFVSFSVFLV